MLASALIIGFSVASVSVLFQIYDRRARALRFRDLILKPNCLLTREPLVFLRGPRSLFRLYDHWNDVPLYLREHGYEVYVIETRGRGVEARSARLTAALARLKFAARPLFHLIADGSLEHEIESLADLKLERVSTYTVVKSDARGARGAHRDVSRAARISTRDLRPPSAVVEVFEIKSAESATNCKAHFKLALLKAHGIWVQGRANLIHPDETAEVSTDFKAERRFLDLAISLAERDAIGSD